MNSDRTYYSHDAEMRAMRERLVLSVLILLVGLGTGALLALLYAPSTGKQTRHDLAKGIEEGVQTGRDAIEERVKQH
jgi:hypothetical protein